MSKLFNQNHGRKGVSPTPLGWFILCVVTFIILYRLYDMGAKRKLEAGPDPVDRSKNAYEKKLELFQKKAKEAVDELPAIPLFDHEVLDGKAYMEHIEKPNVKDFPVKYILSPNVTCVEPVDMIVLVRTEPKSANFRNGIRMTWGLPSNFAKSPIKPVFKWKTIFIMASSGDNYDDVVIKEHAENNDVIQGDFFESKYEDTRKLMMGMKWLAEKMTQCPPKYVLKVADNTYVNIPLLTAWASKKFPIARDLYVGRILRKDQPIRDKTHPLYVSRNDYRPKYFPDIIQGPAYLFSGDVITRMVPLFKSVTPIAMEDAYIGILAEKISVTPLHNERFHLTNVKALSHRKEDACHQIRIFFIHGIESVQHLVIFNNNQDAQEICKNAHFGVNHLN
ncbi:beta-1,3-galactosyltransferase 5-like [Tubulanus polymorphus]|uniref:beta-1,3-galactosyltransferase 5-like n=1 Tax=Tubulanus polymorphus TaxID=672921 RepID=UPI003DA2E1BD